MVMLDVFIAEHDLSLAHVVHRPRASQETEAFSASICVGGDAVATAENSGWGGPTSVSVAGKPGSREAYAKIVAALRVAVEADEAVLPSTTMEDLADRLLYVQVLMPKSLRSVIGRTKIAWATSVKGQYTTVRWPELHNAWKTGPAAARATFIAYGVKQGFFTADTVPTFVNDIVLEVTA